MTSNNFPAEYKEPKDPEQKVEIRLTRAQALVLFEFLSRFSEEDKLEIEDQAEERVLWDICGDLERLLVEPFHPDYKDILQRARNSIRDPEDKK